MQSSVGKQSLARCHSYSAFSFGTAKQRESAAKATPSPGPVYEPRGTRSGVVELPAYSFGNEIRVKNRDPSVRTPGPGHYNTRSSMGSQAYSTQRSAPTMSFGQPSTQQNARGILPLEGRHSPGPIYLTGPACRKQVASDKRSMPTMVFSRDERFRNTVAAYAAGPGPGDYVI